MIGLHGAPEGASRCLIARSRQIDIVQRANTRDVLASVPSGGPAGPSPEFSEGSPSRLWRQDAQGQSFQVKKTLTERRR